MSVTINASTSSGLVQTADTSGIVEIQSNGTTKFTVASTGAYGQITSGTAVTSPSGTSVSFANIPSWVKRVTLMFGALTTSGSSNVQVQLGTGGTPTYTTSGYVGSVGIVGVQLAYTTGYGLSYNISGSMTGLLTIDLLDSSTNLWVASGNNSRTGDSGVTQTAGRVALASALTALRITTVSPGTDTFTAGSFNILYE